MNISNGNQRSPIFSLDALWHHQVILAIDVKTNVSRLPLIRDCSLIIAKGGGGGLVFRVGEVQFSKAVDSGVTFFFLMAKKGGQLFPFVFPSQK